MIRLLIAIHGIVQGVGFRPFIARQAKALGLAGFVRNTAYGVEIDCEGGTDACHALVARIRADCPPGAVLFSLDAAEAPPLGRDGFAILASDAGAPRTAVSPDLGLCADCEAELLDPQNRRHGYPFINCTNCGPRFSIIARVPYDRAHTSMAGFAMCPECASEYRDPEDRRHHAQPNACPVCGPRVRWLEPDGEGAGDPLERFSDLISKGGIAAVKGLGGFHLACDPWNAESVALLRARKLRDEKPFALMARDLACIRVVCEVSPEEEQELRSSRRPIVLLRRRPDCALPEALAPGLDRLGVMLAYTPLHVLLALRHPLLVMTSANRSDEPRPYRDDALDRLWPLCDAVLMHDRPILRRVDDSVCVFPASGRQLIRRSRGFAPLPVPLRPGLTADNAPPLLAFGGQLKNTFCACRDGHAYLSAHIGDLDDAAACDFYEREIPSFLALFGVRPELLAHDLHPDYASTHVALDYAKRFPEARLVPVQHHRAHFASVLGEHGLEEAVGIIFDGTGYGEDGNIWGGEVFQGGVTNAERVGSLRPLRLIGGDAAVREPWRAALDAVAEACSDAEALAFFQAHAEAPVLLRLLRRGAHAPLSSGMGRLFDVFACLAGLRCRVSYEGQAAIALEQAYDGGVAGRYALDIARDGGMLAFDWRPAVREAVADRARGASASVISTKFHRTVVCLVEAVAEHFPGLPVALSGGVFQNLRLLEGASDALRRRGRAVYRNAAVPPNDGGISFGQAVYAAALVARSNA